jgi:hypothetical protein
MWPWLASGSLSTGCSLRRLDCRAEGSSGRYPAFRRRAEPLVLGLSPGGSSERRSEHGLLVHGARLVPAQRFSCGPGHAEAAPIWRRSAPLRLERRWTGGGGGGRPTGHRHDSVAASAREGRAGFSASEWPGCGSVSVAGRRAEARRGPGRSAFPETRAGSRAGPFRSIPLWPSAGAVTRECAGPHRIAIVRRSAVRCDG